jgi:hypothetical protein
LRIGVRRREQNFVTAGTEEGACRLADAGRDALRLSARQVHDVDLVERITGLAFALEDHALAVG